MNHSSTVRNYGPYITGLYSFTHVIKSPISKSWRRVTNSVLLQEMQAPRGGDFWTLLRDAAPGTFFWQNYMLASVDCIVFTLEMIP